MLIGSRVCELRTQKGITQEELAGAVNASVKKIARLEKYNAKRLNFDFLICLVQYLGTTADFLLGRTDNPCPKIK